MPPATSSQAAATGAAASSSGTATVGPPPQSDGHSKGVFLNARLELAKEKIWDSTDPAQAGYIGSSTDDLLSQKGDLTSDEKDDLGVVTSRPPPPGRSDAGSRARR